MFNLHNLVFCVFISMHQVEIIEGTNRSNYASLQEIRIINGNLMDIKKIPYQVSLEYNSYLVCGGSIIASSWVLTAGHCVRKREASSFIVRAGSSEQRKGGKTHMVEQIIKNPNFKNYLDYDFALMKVLVPLGIGQPGIASIALASNLPRAFTSVQVSGWGRMMYGLNTPTSVELRAVNLRIVNHFLCNLIFYRFRVTPRAFCAVGFFQSACNGDSGGPVTSATVAGRELVGVVSWARYCSILGHPGVFANVASVRTWIRDTAGV